MRVATAAGQRQAGRPARGHQRDNPRGALSCRSAHQPRVQVALAGFGFLWLIGLGAWTLAARSIQKRKRENQESMAVFRELFDGAPVAYHELDMRGVIIRVNKAECELLGFSAPELLGRPAWELIASTDREASRQAVARKLSGEQPLVPVLRHYVRRDGTAIVLEIHDTLVKNAAGVTTGLRSCSSTSRTARRQRTICGPANNLTGGSLRRTLP